MCEYVWMLLDDKGHDVEMVDPEASVASAVVRMNERKIGSVLVGDRYRPGEPYRPVGIFTERDVLVRVVAKGRDPTTTLVGEVMTPDPVTIHANTTVDDALRLVTERRCRHLPVVDDAGLCGLVSIGDLIKWVLQEQGRTICDLQDFIQRP